MKSGQKNPGSGSEAGTEAGASAPEGAGGASSAGGWRNRIVGNGEMSPAEILANPLNWRIHSGFQRDAVEGALAEIGWIQQPVINRTTGHLIDGHLRVSVALAKGERIVPVLFVELTEEEEKLALATLDSLGGLAIMDGPKLAELMQTVSVSNDRLNEFLDGLRQDAGELTMSAHDPSGSGRDLAPRDVAVKAVIIVPDLALVEAAIAAAGNPVRGDALVAICKHYLESRQKAAA